MPLSTYNNGDTGSSIRTKINDAITKVNEIDERFVEGTFSPTFSASTTPPTGVAYTLQSGRYTRLGRNWLLEGRMIVSDVGSGGVGVAYMGGLPAASGLIGFTTALRATSVTIPAGGIMAGLIDGARVYFQYLNNSGPNDIAWSSVSSGFDLIFTVQFTT